MRVISPDSYPSAIAHWMTLEHPTDLGPGKPAADGKAALNLTVEELFEGVDICDESYAKACLSGILLRLDYLDASHRVSQDIDTATGSFWHGIMHRREPDYWNSKYWFRRVGNHPILSELSEDAAELGFADFDPYRFVDAVEAGGDEAVLKALQEREWALLFDYSFQKATKL